MFRIGESVVISSEAFVHDTAILYGKVNISDGASVFPYVVMRAEVGEIFIGEKTNVQDHVIVHVGLNNSTVVGRNCSIAHRATLHGCVVGDNCLIGIGATIMDGAVIGDGCVVAGHAIVSAGMAFEADSIIAGIPARKIGQRNSSVANKLNAEFYERIAKAYASGLDRVV